MKRSPPARPARKPASTPGPAAWRGPLEWLAFLAVAAGAALRLRPALLTSFCNDDFVYVDAAWRRGWGAALLHPLRLGGYLRPLSRDVHFKLAGMLFGARALPYHVLNLALVVACAALVWRVGRRWLSPRGALLAAALFAFSHVHAVLVGWASCDQDLWALALALGSTLLFSGGRTALSAAALAAALLCKESVAFLPVALFALALPAGGWRAAARRVAPHAAVAAAWVALYAALRSGAVTGAGAFDARAAAALPLRFALAAVGVEGPRAWPAALGRDLPVAALALAAAAGVALLFAGAGGRRGPAWPWLAWAAAALVPLLPVAGQWSGYYFAAPLAGLCLAAGALSDRVPAAALPALPALLLISGQATLREPLAESGGARDASVSAVSLARLEFVTGIVERAFQDLPSQVPAPPARTLFLFSDLPDWNGLVSGDAPAVRVIYADSTLAGCYPGDIREDTHLDRPLCNVTFDPGPRAFRASVATEAVRATLMLGLEISARTPGAVAALRDQRARGAMDRATYLWHLAYLRWESGDTVAAAAAWDSAAALTPLTRAQALERAHAAATLPSAAARLRFLLPAACAAPRESAVLLAAGDAARQAGDPLVYVLYYRAAALYPTDRNVLEQARKVMVWGSQSLARESIERRIRELGPAGDGK